VQLKSIFSSFTFSRPLTKCSGKILKKIPIVFENKFLVSSFMDGYCLIEEAIYVVNENTQNKRSAFVGQKLSFAKKSFYRFIVDQPR
jgi:hypothetical protein